MADIRHNHIKVLLKEYATGDYVEDATPDLVQAMWTYKKNGGLESFIVVLARDNPGLGSLDAPIVEIWCQDANDSWTMVASGQARRPVPMYEASRVPLLTCECVGYLQQLHNVELEATWDNTDIDDIVNDVIDNYVAADSDISRWAAKATAGSGTAITRLEFKGTAYQIIMHLAEMLGDVEWGVMPALIGGTWYPAKFYFVSANANVNNNYFSSEMMGVEYEYNVDRVRNSLILRGDWDTATGDAVEVTDEDATSIAAYGEKKETITNPYVDNATDGATYLAALLLVLKDPSKGLGFTLMGKGVSDRIEQNIPYGVAHVWEVFSDVNSEDWYINSCTYIAKQDGTIDMAITLGDKLGPRQIYPPSLDGAGGFTGERNWLPNYGRGGYNKLNPNYDKVDWSRTGPRGKYYSKAWWAMHEKGKR